MRHKVSGRKLNRTASHRDAMFSNMATSILEKERITTTLTKAKEVRSVVERLITYGKKGDLHGIRLAARRINNKTVLKKLVEDIAPGYKDREGGYTRIIKIGERKGDNAPMSIIELVGRGNPDAVRKKTKKKAKTKRTPNKVETPKAVVTEEPTQPEVAAEEQEIKDEGVTEQEKKEQQEGSENKAQEEEK